MFVAVAVSAAALASMPAVSLARHAKAHLPRIYISLCGTPAVAPPRFLFGPCGDALGPLRQAEALDLKYRHYGTGLVLASGEVRVCLGPSSQVLALCGEYPEYPKEEPSFLSYPAAFRFFDVVSCTSRVYVIPSLFYGKFSYTFAGRPWETRSHLPPNNFFVEHERLRCHPVTLPRR
jgi:hypothetical protein